MTKKWAVICVLVLGVSVFAGCIQFEEHTATDSLAPLSPEPHQEAEAIPMEENRTDPANAYNDSSPRFHNTVEGREESKRTVDVPLGADRLRVALIHDSDGKVTFSLHKPGFILGGTVAEEEVSGEKYMDEPEWVVIHDPLPGEWTLNINVKWHSLSSYTIGVYLE